MSEIDYAFRKLQWMRDERIWPNGLRYLWTDAFGVVLLLSLHESTGQAHFLKEAIWVVNEVDRVLGRERGIRIGEEPDRDGQYFHYLAMWLFALWRLGRYEPVFQTQAVALAKTIYARFVIPDVGVFWKMREDLSGPYPGFGLGALDAFHGLAVYRLLDAVELELEIKQFENITSKTYRTLHITQDLGLGMMLWISHFFPTEPWAAMQRSWSLRMLDEMWIDPPGYFCREPGFIKMRFAFTNYGVSVGLQAVNANPDRVQRLNKYFENYRSGDEYDRNAITHVMACSSHFPGQLIQARP